MPAIALACLVTAAVFASSYWHSKIFALNHLVSVNPDNPIVIKYTSITHLFTDGFACHLQITVVMADGKAQKFPLMKGDLLLITLCQFPMWQSLSSE